MTTTIYAPPGEPYAYGAKTPLKATFSCELAKALFVRYVPLGRKHTVVLDPYSGSGTVAIDCIDQGYDYIGLEINGELANSVRRRLTMHLENLVASAPAAKRARA